MKLIDTHAHFQFEAYDDDRQTIIKDNLEELSAIMTVGTSLDSSKKAVSLVQDYSQLFASVGIHPHHVDQWSKDSLAELRNLTLQPKVVAIGEIGLDKHPFQGYPQPDLGKQIALLLPQIELARELNLPILFHCREAYEELYELIKDKRPVSGLMHCFMGDKNIARKFLDLGLFISFSGNLTYKNNDYIREAAAFVPEDRLLVETDSPFLAPVPFRGQRNEPKYVKIVLETVSLLKKLSVEKLGQATTNNSLILLNLK